MGVFGGPNVSEDGLVLALDAGNPRNFDLTAVEVLVVAGGGGGGGSHGAAGGGGAGGLVYHSSKQVTPGTQLTVTIGLGGQGGRYYGASSTGNYGASNNSHGFQGGNSSFGDIVAIGGGGGNESFYTDSIYKNGGSGGGAGDYYFGVANPGASRGGLATQTDSGGGIGYGFPGGSRGPGGPTTAEDNSHAIPHEGSGGGGAGGTATGGGPSQPSNGGIGRYYPQFIGAGSPEGWFAGGGGGGYYYYGPYTSTNAPNTDTGWKGGGGRGCNGNTNYDAQDGGTYARGRGTTAGTPNTGGGGGGGSGNNTTPNAPDGGSGIVIVRYQGPQKAIGGTVTSVGGDTIHTFTTSGNFTPLVNTNGSAVLGLSDLSGNRNFGTTAGSPTYSSANGGSLYFEGSDEYVTTYNPGIVTKLTVSVWLKVSTYSNDGAGIAIGTNSQGTGQCYLGRGSSGGNSIDWRFYTGSYLDETEFFTNSTDWQHIVGTYDQDTGQGRMRLYANGSLVDTALSNNTSGINFSTGSNIRIGTNTGDSSFFGGNIAQVSIYNRALSAAEVSQNYNATKGRYEKGGINNPFSSPTEARILGYTSGDYYFNSGSMSSPQLLEFQRDYYENRGWVCVFRSPYASTATTNKIDLSIPMGGLLVQRDALDLRAAVYWSTPITYTTVGGSGNNTADSGYSPRRVILGGSGGHGIFATNQQQCSWGTATGAIGAGWDGGTCGSFPNGLIWGTGRSDTATYENRSGIWSHWITWG